MFCNGIGNPGTAGNLFKWYDEPLQELLGDDPNLLLNDNLVFVNLRNPYSFIGNKGSKGTDNESYLISGKTMGKQQNIMYSGTNVPMEDITFEGYFHSTDTLQVNYTDDAEETINAKVYVYEVNTSTGDTDFVTSHITADDNEFTFNITDCNTNNAFFGILYVNHTMFGWFRLQIWFDAEARSTVSTPKDSLFNANYGGNPFGWSNTFMWLFLAACFFSFGQRGTGIALTVTGGMTIFISSYIGFNTTMSTVAGGVLPILMILIGIMVMFRNYGRGI